MTGFWHSELGELSGTAEAAFTKSIDLVPDGTMALAKIKDFKNDSFGGDKFYKIEWILADGEFKGKHIFHKIKVYDPKPTTRHTALNMMMLIFKMFGVSPQSNNPPSDQDLRIFCDKIAGIKIQETKPNEEGKQYNYVSEVHPAAGFKSVTGHRRIVSPIVNHTPGYAGVESALTRNARKPENDELDMDEIPF